jgi:nucleotide-binding universal stress UspA family protein
MSAIVTGVDGSDTAKAAADKAAKLAFALGSELVVVCAYEKLEIQEVDTGDQYIEFTTEEEAEAIAKRTLTPLVEAYPGLKSRVVAAKGAPADVLLDTASAVSADIIVVGNKRAQGVARVLGSIASEVTRKAACDVYIAYTHPRD